MTRERGFTLIEAVIALAVLAVGLLLIGSLMVGAQKMLAQAGIEARTPSGDLALERLQAEIQGASRVERGPLTEIGWSRDHLELVFPDGRRVRYEKRGPELRRAALAADAAAWGPGRSVLTGVFSWRWVRSGQRLVTVEIVYDAPSPTAPALDPAAPVDHARRSRRARARSVTAALRGGGLGWGW